MTRLGLTYYQEIYHPRARSDSIVMGNVSRMSAAFKSTRTRVNLFIDRVSSLILLEFLSIVGLLLQFAP